MGRIAAGLPVESVEQRATLSFADFVGHPGTFALEVRGESMIGDHICDGDMVLLERANEVRDGEIVVALVDGSETTLKRFYREPGGKVRLQPANAALQPIVVPAADVQIQGAFWPFCANISNLTIVRAKCYLGSWLVRDGHGLAGAQLLLGAQPVFFGRAALIAARFPIGIC